MISTFPCERGPLKLALAPRIAADSVGQNNRTVFRDRHPLGESGIDHGVRAANLFSGSCKREIPVSNKSFQAPKWLQTCRRVRA